MKKILVVEDDSAISMGLELIFQEDNYDVTTINDGKIAYETALKKQFDLIILDIMLPNKNGYEICKDLRSHKINTPVLFLSSKNEEMDKIVGFEKGGDDYMTKPFSIMELKLRVKAILRRGNSNDDGNYSNSYKFADFELVPDKFDLFREGKAIGLSVKEFHLLKFLIDRKGIVISRDEILDKVWGYDNYPTTRTVDNYILSIRKKIEPDPANPIYLLTVPTIGYKLSESDSIESC